MGVGERRGGRLDQVAGKGISRRDLGWGTPGTGNLKCKDPWAGVSSEGLRTSKEAGVAGAERARGEKRNETAEVRVPLGIPLLHCEETTITSPHRRGMGGARKEARAADRVQYVRI